MSDFISRQEILGELKKINIGLLTELRHAQEIQDELIEIAIKNQMSAMHTAIEHVKATPTAYDVDKVVEQLENKIFSAEVHNDDFNGVQIDNLLCMGDVYEIVKAGGMDG